MSVGIIGAGPAGLLTGSVLAAGGQAVTLIDEQPDAGGHLRYDDYELGDGASSAAWLTELHEATGVSGVESLTGTVAWGAFRVGDGFELALNRDGRVTFRACSHLVVAAGTTDVPWVGAGSTLPGVLTARAARILVNRHGVLPGRRIVVLGSGSEAERLVTQLAQVGAEAHFTDAISAIAGDGQVEAVILEDGATVPADVVVLAIGELPDIQVAGMLEAPRRFDPAISGWRVESFEAGPALYVVGGALRGRATPGELVQDALSVAERITGTRALIDDTRLPMSAALAASEAIRR
jgi:sarcosine oxidase subunit alpha